jgi:hypothetical protein
MTTWELRYRAPRSIDNVQIETFTDNEAEAKALADAYLATLASPSIRFVYVRRIVVARSADYADVAAKFKPATKGNGEVPAPPAAPRAPKPSASARAKAADKPAAPATAPRVGA